MKNIITTVIIAAFCLTGVKAQRFQNVNSFEKIPNSEYYEINNARYSFNAETGQFISVNESVASNYYGIDTYYNGDNKVSSRNSQNVTIYSGSSSSSIDIILPVVNGENLAFETKYFYPHSSQSFGFYDECGYNGTSLYINGAYYFQFDKFEFGEDKDNVEDKIGQGVCYWDESEEKIIYLRGTEVEPDYLWTLYGSIGVGSVFKDHLFFEATWHDDNSKLFYYGPESDRPGLDLDHSTFISFKDTSLNSGSEYSETLKQTDSLLYILYSNESEYFVSTLNCIERNNSDNSDFYVLLADRINGIERDGKAHGYAFANENYFAMKNASRDTLIVLDYMANVFDTIALPTGIAAKFDYVHGIEKDGTVVFSNALSSGDYESKIYVLNNGSLNSYKHGGNPFHEITKYIDYGILDSTYYFTVEGSSGTNSYTNGLLKIEGDTLLPVAENDIEGLNRISFSQIGNYTFLNNSYRVGQMGNLDRVSWSNGCPGLMDTLTLPVNDGLSLQWYKNNTIIEGAINDTLIITYADTSEQYYATASKESNVDQYSRIYTATPNSYGKPEIYSPAIVDNGCTNGFDNVAKIIIDARMEGSTWNGEIIQDSMFLSFQDTVIKIDYNGSSSKYTIQGNAITIKEFSANDAGMYQVKLYGGECAYTASTDTIQVDTIGYPTIHQGIKDSKGCLNMPFEMTAIATESDGSPLSYFGLNFSETDNAMFNSVAYAGSGDDRSDTLTYKVDTFKVENSGYYFLSMESKCFFDPKYDTIQVGLGQPYALTSPPTDTANCAGTDISLSVAASTEGSLSYQWFKDNVIIADATDSLLNISELAEADAGLYKVQLLGDCQTDDLSATVSMYKSTEIVSVSADTTINEGENISFLVEASGEGELSYQWMYNSSDIPEAISADLDLLAVTEANNGEYNVKVNGLCGEAISDTFILTVKIVEGGGDGTSNNETLRKDISVFPNPTARILNIEIPYCALVKVYNASGVLISTKQISGNSNFDMSNYANGLYIAKVITNKGTITYQIVKQ